MARRRSSVAEFMDGFNSTYGSVRKVLQDKELMDIAKAAPTDLAPVSDVTYTEGENGGPAVGSTVETAPQQTKFLGQTYDKPLNEAQLGSARTMAMAGVMKKYGDPVGGLRLEQQAREGDQREKLTALQISQAERAGKRDEKDDAHRATIEAVDRDVADWNTRRLTNPDGSMRELTPDDMLAASQYRVSKLVSAGKLTEANALAKDNFAMTKNKIDSETAVRNEALAQVSAAAAAGDLSKVGAFYDKFIPDGGKVKGVVVDPQTGKITVERETIDGRAAPPVSFKDRNEMIAALNTFKDPDALYKFSLSEFHRNLQTKADQRADKAELRADKSLQIQAGTAAMSNRLHGAQLAEIEQKTADRKAVADIHNDLATAINAGDKAAETKARAKLMTYMVGSKGVQMSDIERKANFFLASGKAKTMEEAATMAHQAVQKSPADDFRDFAKPQGGVMPSEADVAKAMTMMHGPDWKSKVRGEAPDKPLEFASAAEADAAAKAGKVKKGTRVIVNGVPGTWQ